MALAAAMCAPAAAQTWTGAGGDGDWSNAANWTPGPPVSGPTTNLVFGTNGSGFDPTNDVPGFTLRILTLNDGFTQTITGQSLIMRGADPQIAMNSNDDLTVTNDIAFIDEGAGYQGIFVFGTGTGNLTLSGNLSQLENNSQFRAQDAVTVTLSGTNSYTGLTDVIQGSTLIAASDFALGAVGGATFADTGSTLALTGNIDLQESLIRLRGAGVGGNGALRNLSGNNTVLGVISLENAPRIQSDADTLTLSGGITSVTNQNLTFGGAGDIVVDSVIATGTGSVTVAGSGTTTFSGANTYTGGTTISGGILQLGDGGAAGSFVGNVLNNGTLAFNRNNTMTFAGIISGTGAVIQMGTGTTILTGINTYSGGTFLDDGTLSVSADDNLGAAAGALTFNSGTLQNTAGFSSDRGVTLNAGGGTFETLADLTWSGVIGGAGGLTKSGASALILTDENTYGGGTTISTGTLQLGDGGTSGAIVGDVVADGTLAFNRSDSIIFDGVISGAGAIRHIGSGLTDLTANSSGFTGTTSVEAGTLAVNGSLCGDIDVLSGGRLHGTGTVCDVDNFAGGAVGPGNSIGAMTISGAYFGTGGTLEIEAVLGDDSSPTDQLILAGGGASASGSTSVQVINLGGAGALTTGFGIPIVVAQGGAVTTGSAFSLAGPVAVGPFQYLLFRGPQSGGTADDQNSWFLRSFLQQPDDPLYRPETSMYAALPGEARALGLMTLGTFHERNGDQGLARGQGGAERAWGRIFGAHLKQASPGSVDASFSGYAGGVQLGIDALHFRGNGGEQDVAGLFFALPQARGDVNGFVLGVVDAYAGNSQLTGPGYGAYFTHIGPSNWYVDAAAMASFYEATGTSANSAAIDVDATGVIASLEGGWPLLLGGGVTLEPQAQLVYQHLDFDRARDTFSSVAIDAADVLTGRLGVRLAGEFGAGLNMWRPYLKADLWHDWGGTDRVIYAGVNELTSDPGVTALEAGGGLVVQLTEGVGVWGDAAYTTDVAGSDLEIVKGNAGVKVSW